MILSMFWQTDFGRMRCGMSYLLPLPLLLLVTAFSLPHLPLVTLDRLPKIFHHTSALLVIKAYFLCLNIGFVGVVKGNLKLVDITLKLLLDPQGLRLSLLLRV